MFSLLVKEAVIPTTYRKGLSESSNKRDDHCRPLFITPGIMTIYSYNICIQLRTAWPISRGTWRGLTRGGSCMLHENNIRIWTWLLLFAGWAKLRTAFPHSSLDVQHSSWGDQEHANSIVFLKRVSIDLKGSPFTRLMSFPEPWLSPHKI